MFDRSWVRRSGAGLKYRVGVSLLAISAMGCGAVPAMAQESTGTIPQTPPSIENPESDEGKADDVIVTARRAAIESAIRRKENSDTIIDSVLADDAGKLPDNSITEVLQRVAGVTIVRFDALGDPDHFSAQGSGIQVRGLSGVAGRLNGREIFSASGGRGLSFGDVTPELMAAVDVYKASTADLVEGGTGGQIDLRTKMPFDYREFTVQGSLNGSYGDLRKKVSYGASVLATGRVETGIGEFGLLVDIARNEFLQLSHFLRTEPYYKTRIGAADYFIPGGFTYGDQDYERSRTGLYAALQWRPVDTLTISQTFFQSKYEEESFGHGVFVTSKVLRADPATSQFDSNNGLISSPNLFLSAPTTFLPVTGTITAGGNTGFSAGTSKTTDWSTAVDWQASDRMRIRAAFQYVKSTSTRQSYDLFPAIPYPGNFAIDLSGKFPEVTLPASSLAGFDDPARYMWNASQDHLEDNRGTLYSGNVDFEYDLSDDGFFRTFKTGMRYADRSERDNNSGYNWQAFGQGWNGSPATFFSGAAAGEYNKFVFENFFRGQANLPTSLLLPSDAAAKRFDVAGDHVRYGNRIPADSFGPLDLTSSRSNSMSAYALVRFQEGDAFLGVPVQGNVGARFISNKNQSNGFFQQNTSTFQRNGVIVTLPTVGAPRAGSRTYERLLPSVNVQLLPDPTVHIRAGYNITLDNPSFTALRAAGSLSIRTTGGGGGAPGIFDGFTTDAGNPRLKPLISNNLDLSAEWYPKGGTALHVSLFHKTLENVLIYGSSNQQVDVTLAGGVISRETVQSTNIFNATENAKIKGVEAGFRTFFDMLPGVLSGFGVEANYTFIDSKNPGDSYIDINGVRRADVPLTGLSKNTFNVTGLYEKGKVSARLAYSWRSRYLMTTNSNGTNGDYVYYKAPTPGTTNCSATAPVNPFCQFTDISLPIYSEPYGSLDAGFTFRFSKNISASIQGSNLLNEVAKTSMGGYDNGQRYIRSWFVSDRRIDGSIRFSF
ncbi:TonB-dependent receptor [Sphingomonas sp.]|uniref:TonB-dependent receptor n=1 Tax=Sphingomonas sp. TaxID=28214 RepID=UPI002ED77C05